MGNGLRRVAKQCGGLEVVGRDGNSVHYGAGGEPLAKSQERTSSQGAAESKAGGRASVKNYDEASEGPSAKNPRTYVNCATPGSVLAQAVRKDPELRESPLGKRIGAFIREANAERSLLVVDNDPSYLEPLRELQALRGAESPEGVEIQKVIDAWFRHGGALQRATIFPYARKFEDLFAAARPFDSNNKEFGEYYLHTSKDAAGKFASMAVTPHPEVSEGLREALLGGMTFYFEAVRRDFPGEETEYLVVVNYDQIIGGRWLACLDPESVEAAFLAHNPRPDHSILPPVEHLEQKRPEAYVEHGRNGEVYVMHQGVRTRHESETEANCVVGRLNGSLSTPPSPSSVGRARNGSSFMVKITDDVRAVLVDSTPEGNVLKLPGQLERGLYQKVDETLDLLGGKWNRQKGGHVFAEDPAVVIAEALENGAVEDGMKRYQYYPTPKVVAQRLVALADFHPSKIHWVLEPSGGSGAILDEIPSSASLHACEIQPVLADALKAKGYMVEGTDFLAFNPGPLYDRIVANPPFTKGQDIAHINHMLDCLAPGGRLVSVLSAGIDFRKDKATTALLARLQKECSRFYFEDLESGAFRESGTLVNAKVLVADKNPETR
jgi:hypothetical protein